MSLAIAYAWFLAKVAFLVAGLLLVGGLTLLGYFFVAELIERPRY